MTTNPHIGEASAQVGEREFVFRPTLVRIAEIGTPAEIVEVFALVMSEPTSRTHWVQRMVAALVVLYACADQFDRDLERLLGAASPWPQRYNPGVMPADDVIHLARQMLRHGVVGVQLEAFKRQQQEQGRQRGDYSAEFSPAEFAAQAVAHLGVTVDQAWSMTMTSIVQALAAKYPPPRDPAGPPVTLERNDAATAWIAKVNALRKQQKVSANG